MQISGVQNLCVNLGRACQTHTGSMPSKMPDSREIIASAYYIEKLISENNYEGIECHLAHLGSVEVTVEHLQETDAVGAVYSVFRKCPDRALKKKAKCLLVKWKKFYKNHCLQSKPNQDGAPGNGEKIDHYTIVPEPQRKSSQEPSAPETVALISSIDADGQPEPRSNESSSEQAQIQKQAVRVKCTELLYQALTASDARSENLQDLAKLIEEEIFAIHGGSDKKYKNCIRSKVANLKNPKNSHLHQHLCSGALSPKAFAEMTVMEMASDELKQLRASYTESSVQEHQLPQNNSGMQTNKIKCRRCETFDCTVTMIARGTLFLPAWVRNGNPDEEMMTFVICNTCGGKWYHSKWVCL
ncbi:transcription elongation factor A N-terminal and central domain-containing protein isoform X2 [Microcaecilia unicolor]|uniref:Transcription elongation factor A N-terminal and central domain-containing protein isoform X2 n=1 Tax=Microcaecilia unicolor TaxID=1415580 RepID=A0A6P7XSD5_9AMPH|nr:transcription elongation factor A N-terminal and central domain-containing protein isoform X2 [Microcaecilia unicolor]